MIINEMRSLQEVALDNRSFLNNRINRSINYQNMLKYLFFNSICLPQSKPIFMNQNSPELLVKASVWGRESEVLEQCWKVVDGSHMCCEQGKEKEKEKCMRVLCVPSFRIPKCGCRYKRSREPQGHGRGHYPYRRRKRLTSQTEALQMHLARCFSRGSPSSLLPLGHEHTSCITLLFLFGGTGRGPWLPQARGRHCRRNVRPGGRGRA